jgi:hypothetical protein
MSTSCGIKLRHGGYVSQNRYENDELPDGDEGEYEVPSLKSLNDADVYDPHHEYVHDYANSFCGRALARLAIEAVELSPEALNQSTYRREKTLLLDDSLTNPPEGRRITTRNGSRQTPYSREFVLR